MLIDEHDAELGATKRGGPVQVFFHPAGSPRRPAIVRGEGVYFWDSNGRRYIDASSGPVVNNLGHANMRVVKAMADQASKVAFAYPRMFESEANIELADLLTNLAGPGLERAFFVSGGSEATETAIKFARQYALTCGEAKRFKIIGREPGYHGATLGALSVTGDDHAEEIWGPMMRPMPKVPAPFTYRTPPNHTPETYARFCADALEEEIVRQGPDTVLAFIMEPVGGLATGALVAPDIYYDLVRQICSRHGVLLIYDEVMSGAGRTGKFLAADHWPSARPDIVTLAKGVAAGYTPFGAVLASREMVDAVAGAGGFMHSFTYFTNPLSCAVGVAVLREVVERGLIDRAAQMGDRLRARLLGLQSELTIIGDVRGKGLLQAIELVSDQKTKQMIPLECMAPYRVQALGLENGIALYCRRTSRGKYGDWVMMSPPLVITEAELDELIDRLRRTLLAFEDELRKGRTI